MSYRIPLVIKYGDDGLPVGLTESNQIFVSAVSATNLIVNSVSAASSNIAPDFDEVAFVLNNQDFTGSPFSVQKVTFYAPSSNLPLIIYNPGTVVTLAGDGSSLTVSPESNVTHDNLNLHFGNYVGTNGNNIHWHLSTLNSYFINTSGDTMTGTLNAPVLSSIQYADFNLTAAPAANEGRLRWNDDFKTLEVDSAGSDYFRVGQEVSIRIKNNTGSPLTPGTVVYVSGFDGNVPAVALASASSEGKSHKGMGVVKTTINDNNRGLMIVKGILSGVNTSGYTNGEIVKLDTVPGQYRSGLTPAPSHNEWIGSVVKAGTGTTDGILFVDIQHGYEIHELHDVSRTNPSATGQILVWNNTGGYYQPGSHNDLAELTTDNPHTQYATLSGATFTGTINAPTVSATTYQNLPIDIRPLAFTIDNPSSVGTKPLFYSKNLSQISEIHSVIVGSSPSSVTWSLYITSDITTIAEEDLIISDTTSSTTAGDNTAGDSLSEGWVVLGIDDVVGSVDELHLTLHVY